MRALNRDIIGRWRRRSEWMLEGMAILLEDQARASISDAEFESILDSADGRVEYGADVELFVEAWRALHPDTPI